MRETLLYPEIWKKSFLLEIDYHDGTTESFTFSLPPENVEIIISQRVSETDTFGGLFIDDYGIGKSKIHLAGTTGNSCVKKIYRGDETAATWLTGKEEIFYLRDKIIRYKEGTKFSKQKKEATLYLYNLGANSEVFDSDESTFSDSWEVLLKEFKISQNKDKPFIYAYSVDFTGIRILGESRIRERGKPVNINEKDVSKFNKFLKQCLDGIEKWYGWSESVKNKVQDVRNAVARYSGEVERYLAMITGSVDNYMKALLNGVYTATDVYNTFKRTTMAPADCALSVIKTMKALREEIEHAIADIKSLPDQWLDKYGGVKTSFTKEIEEYKRFFEDIMQDGENAANEQYTQSVSQENRQVVMRIASAEGVSEVRGDDIASGGSIDSGGGEESGGSVDSVNGEEKNNMIDMLIIYGSVNHIATSETTLEQLAQIYFGDPDKAWIIASSNGISGDSEIEPGNEIKIPITSNVTSALINYIFGSIDNKDNFGIDIALNNGILQIGSNSDFIAVSGYENINQAITMRLSESLGNRIRLNVYGIRNMIGTPHSVASTYIAASIKDTVLHDPRIEKFDDLYFRGHGDRLYIEFTYYTYDGIIRKYEGGI
jgi:hypothetical protein